MRLDIVFLKVEGQLALLDSVELLVVLFHVGLEVLVVLGKFAVHQVPIQVALLERGGHGLGRAPKFVLVFKELLDGSLLERVEVANRLSYELGRDVEELAGLQDFVWGAFERKDARAVGLIDGFPKALARVFVGPQLNVTVALELNVTVAQVQVVFVVRLGPLLSRKVGSQIVGVDFTRRRRVTATYTKRGTVASPIGVGVAGRGVGVFHCGFGL